MQVNAQRYINPMHCLRLTIREEGARGLLRGLGATLAREVPGNALFFTVYEVCCCYCACWAASLWLALALAAPTSFHVCGALALQVQFAAACR